jgi:predicted aldo/keto reductase-like oxidoreductase
VTRFAPAKLSRREFLAASAAALARLGASAGASPSAPRIRSRRILGRTGCRVSDIGLGSSELTDTALIEAALDAGINYLDCAEVYLGGQVERAFGRVLPRRDRSSLFLTTKVVVRPEESKSSVKRRALKCLERLRTDYLDCFMMHAPPTSEMVRSPGFHGAVRELKAEGRVRFCGLSNHGSQLGDVPEPMDRVLRAAVEDGRFDVLLFVYNFIQRDMGERVLTACREKNLGAAVMKTNPVANYFEVRDEIERLARAGRRPNSQMTALAERLKATADKARPFIRRWGLDNSTAVRGAAVKFALANPGVASVCLTIKNFDDLGQFVALSGRTPSPGERRLLEAYAGILGPFYCRHACGRCEGRCPFGVPVNEIMRFAQYRLQGRARLAASEYAALPGPRASLCLECEGPCQDACPHGVPVQGLLALAHQTLVSA